jgi:hypothetical protein
MSGKNCNDRGYEFINGLKTTHQQNVPDLLALAPKNDPFYAGAPAHWAKATWFAELWTRFHYTTAHTRRIHYRLVTPGQGEPVPCKHDGTPYQNTEGCWDYLNEASKQARYLRLVSPEAIVDHRNPEPQIYMQPEILFRRQGVTLETLGPWSLPAIEHELASLIDLPLPGVEEVTAYDYHATDQPYHLELWIEKSTMDDVLVPICDERHVNLVTSVGFQLITGVVRLLQRVSELIRLRQAKKPIRILYISDFDPAGDQMPVAVARQIEFWLQDYAPGADVKLTPLALTREQVIRYQLPRIPIKDTDARKGRFEERYGGGAMELDALEALYPGALAQVVRDAIEPYRDETLAHRLEEARAEAHELAEEAWDECLAPYREEIETIEQEVRQIAAGYEGELRRLDDRLQAELAPLHARIRAVRQAVFEEMHRFTVDLPERPKADTSFPDEDNWLFASERDYFTQLAMYKARKQGSPSDVSRTPVSA